ncbi:MAG: SdrD B-like domain-containing protein, partial [Pirellulales bacterium]
ALVQIGGSLQNFIGGNVDFRTPLTDGSTDPFDRTTLTDPVTSFDPDDVVIVAYNLDEFVVNSQTHVATWTFPGLADTPLADGNYQVVLREAGITDRNNNPLLGNTDASNEAWGIDNLTVKLRGEGLDVVVGPDLTPGIPDVQLGNETNDGEASGEKFQDNDGNGVRDGGEPGLAGVTIYADVTPNGVLDAGEPFDVTDATGAYTLTRLPAGTYFIREIVPAGYTQTAPTTGAYEITISEGDRIGNLDFGNQPEQQQNQYDFGDSPDTYRTLDASNGAKHLLGSTLFLGRDVDNDRLTGGGADDTYVFEDGFGLDSAIETIPVGTDTLDFSATTRPLRMALGPGASAIVDVANQVSLVGQFEALIGGTAADTLAGDDVANTWQLTGLDTGSIGILSFSGIENLTGGTVADTFAFASGATLTGTIDGGAGFDQLDYSAVSTAVSVDLESSSATDLGGQQSDRRQRHGRCPDRIDRRRCRHRHARL